MFQNNFMFSIYDPICNQATKLKNICRNISFVLYASFLFLCNVNLNFAVFISQSKLIEYFVYFNYSEYELHSIIFSLINNIKSNLLFPMTQHSHLISKKSRLIRVFSLNRLRVFSNNFNDFFSIVSTHIVIKPKCCLMLKQRQNCFEAEWKVATKRNLCRNSSTCLYSWLISQVSHTNDNNKTILCSPSSGSWCYTPVKYSFPVFSWP